MVHLFTHSLKNSESNILLNVMNPEKKTLCWNVGMFNGKEEHWKEKMESIKFNLKKKEVARGERAVSSLSQANTFLWNQNLPLFDTQYLGTIRQVIKPSIYYILFPSVLECLPYYSRTAQDNTWAFPVGTELCFEHIIGYTTQRALKNYATDTWWCTTTSTWCSSAQPLWIRSPSVNWK